MPPALNIGGHSSHLKVWQEALESERGIEVTFPNPIAARDFQKRLYHARRAQEKHHMKVYPADHQMYGRSFYENLTTRIPKDNPCVVRIFPADLVQYEVRKL